MAGITNGTLVRLVQKRVQRVKNTVRQFQLAEQFAIDWFTFWLYQRMKSGAFAHVEGGIPADWSRHKLIYPADDTVDVGREGRLYDDRLMRGNMSPETYHGMQGEDAEDVEDEVIAAAIRRKRKIMAANAELAAEGIALEEGDVFRAPAGSAAAPDRTDPIPPPGDPEDDPENPDDPKKKG